MNSKVKVKNGETKKEESISCLCNCRTKLDPYQIFDDNVDDIAQSLAKIMLTCGINTLKVQKSRSIIKRVFVYHEKLRSQCTPEKENRLCREDLLQALRVKCDMEGMEAYLIYELIKRAFKAFFHGKRPYAISNPILDALAVLDQKSAWMHAAYRTSRIFDNYRAAFFWAEKSYEKQINVIYRELYKRMEARVNPLNMPTCRCRNCSKREIAGAQKPGEVVKEKTFKLKECENLPPECVLCGLQIPIQAVQGKMKPPRQITNHELKLERCNKCNSPRLICECFIDPLTGKEYGECGQDSYKVKWYRVQEDIPEEESTDKCPFQFEDHHCPIDCPNAGSSEVCGVGTEDSEYGDVCSDLFKSCEDEDDTCEEEEDDAVAKLEEYLNKLWNEEQAAKKNPKTFVPSVPPTPCSCQKCG